MYQVPYLKRRWCNWFETNTINPKEEFKIQGLKWTKDSSWGNYYVTRVKDASPIDFDKAMKYSDNIYFAQQALKMGKDQYVNEFKKYGFHEKLPIEYELPISIIAKDGIKTIFNLQTRAMDKDKYYDTISFSINICTDCK